MQRQSLRATLSFTFPIEQSLVETPLYGTERVTLGNHALVLSDRFADFAPLTYRRDDDDTLFTFELHARKIPDGIGIREPSTRIRLTASSTPRLSRSPSRASNAQG